MGVLINLLNKAQDLLNLVRSVDFIGPVLLRIYLVPVFFLAGSNKWDPFAEGGTFNPVVGLEGIANWFESGLELPAPMLLAILAWAAEYLGAIALALGVAVRWTCIPLMFTMIIAMTTVHWDNGWQALHDLKSPYPSANAEVAIDRLHRAKSILEEHGNYAWLTEHGSLVSLNNGIEWAATYFIMLMALFFLGGGRYLSVDYLIARKYRIPAPH
ncbi:MAG: DoxX family protein [Gammaproteobacteria bacterium]|nr:DoxX family protein [Gammaproteobacteria bacterium]